MTSARAGHSLPERIATLDVLRGVALLGMFLVHFELYATGDGTWPWGTAAYAWIVAHLFEERFWTMFGILFGAGFALQLRTAEGRGAPFVAMYLRRLAGLAGFGFIAHGIFGFNVLLGYAIWGMPLLIVRKWSIKALTMLLLASAMSGAFFSIGRAAMRSAAVGEEAARAEIRAVSAANTAFNQANGKLQESPVFAEVVRARIEHLLWFHVQPFSFLPVNTLTLFLIGVIALRLGLFDHPGRHRRLIAILMVLGLVSWAADGWLLPPAPRLDGVPPVRQLVVDHLAHGFGLVRPTWLSWTYIGAVLLLVSRNPAWLGRLSPFGWTGRMALTNYMLQIVTLDLLFSPYALGLHMTTPQALVAGLALFAVDAVASRWWLERFRFGPLEWLWRSMTYAHWQPLTAGPRAVGDGGRFAL